MNEIVLKMVICQLRLIYKSKETNDAKQIRQYKS